MPGPTKKNAPAIVSEAKRAMPSEVKEPDERALKEQVREALLSILTEADAPAGARASAGRSLLEFFGDEAAPGDRAAVDGMSEADINAELARIAAGSQRGGSK